MRVRAMGERVKQTNQSERMNQWVLTFYRSLRKRTGILKLLLMIALFLSMGGIGFMFFANADYQTQQAAYSAQINHLQEQREGILDGTIVPETKEYDTVLQEKLDVLKEYPQNNDEYSVPIEGTNGTIKIDRNNIFVSDNASLLNDTAKNHIYQRNKELAAATTGAQLEVVTIATLPDGEDIASYANKIFNQLGIGDKQLNNGVLYLIALQDKEFRLEVGYGLEGIIPDGLASDIINDDDVVEAFRNEEYSQGILQVVDQVFSLMNTKTALVDSQIEQVQSQKSNRAIVYWSGILSCIILLIISGFLLVRLLKARKELKQIYTDYQRETNAAVSAKTMSKGQLDMEKIKRTELYYLMLSGVIAPLSINSVQRAITQGKLLKQPKAKRMALGRVLVGDTLYSRNGDILTTAYIASNYNSSNWSSNNHSDGGGSSWGSFGGGSSGGGGASGGW